MLWNAYITILAGGQREFAIYCHPEARHKWARVGAIYKVNK